MTRAIAVTLLMLFATSRESSSFTGPSQLIPSAERSAGLLRVYPSNNTPDLVLPVPIQAPNPHYTPEALHAKIQGTIDLEVTVGTDGRVRDAMVTRSLDSTYGMDDRAIAILSDWRFEPGRLAGKSVAVRTVVTFTMSVR
jgi:TonB family protein